MADTTGEMPKTQATEMEAGQQQKTDTEMVQLSKAELEKMQMALKEANREAAKSRKELDAVQAERTKREEAEMTEAQKLAKQLEDATKKLQHLERMAQVTAIASKHNLPAELATRLQGETPEELEADAEKLSKLIAQPEPPKPKAPGPVNPGVASPGVTEAQRIAELTGQPRMSDPFAVGGGVKWGG